MITDVFFRVMKYTGKPVRNSGPSVSVACGLVVSVLAATAHGGDWSQFAGDGQRTGVAEFGPRSFARARWTAALQAGEEFIAGTSPVVGAGIVCLPVRVFDQNVHVATRLIAVDEATGQRRWAADFPADVEESVSSAAIDADRGWVYYGSDVRFGAVRVADGTLAWFVDLPSPIVNASPLITHGLRGPGDAPADRVIITDFGGAAQIYGINIDPTSGGNPFAIGEIAWEQPIGTASGATPALTGARVIVGTYDIVLVPPGISTYVGFVRSFDARTGTPGWMRELGPNDGCFSGLTVRGGAIYGATYDFFGGANNSRLFKLNADDGAVVWSVACERTATIPVVLDDGRVFLSGGIDGFGSSRGVQVFRDLGTTATLTGRLDAGSGLSLGGWEWQIAASDARVYASRVDESQHPPYVELRAYALSAGASSLPTYRASADGVGGPPAIGPDGTLYTYGAAGLRAFAATQPGDLNCDGVLSVGDIGPFVTAITDPAGYPAAFPACDILAADMNDDGVVSVGDIAGFVAVLTGGTP
jgi:outer membrane protein assembly factor BamB